MAHIITVEISDAVYEELKQQASVAKESVEQVAALWMEGTLRELNEDPLIQLLGTAITETDITDVGERHDYYIGQALYKEMARNTYRESEYHA